MQACGPSNGRFDAVWSFIPAIKHSWRHGRALKLSKVCLEALDLERFSPSLSLPISEDVKIAQQSTPRQRTIDPWPWRKNTLGGPHFSPSMSVPRASARCIATERGSYCRTSSSRRTPMFVSHRPSAYTTLLYRISRMGNDRTVRLRPFGRHECSAAASATAHCLIVHSLCTVRRRLEALAQQPRLAR